MRKQKSMIKFGNDEDVRAFIYGAIDGIITTFAIVAGVAGASLSTNIIVILGFANLLADGFSMAASNYLSIKAIQRTKKNTQLRPLRSAFITFTAFNIAGFVPLIPFVVLLFFAQHNEGFGWAIFLTIIAFMIVGSLKTKMTKQSWIVSCAETLLIGGGAAVIAYGIGAALALLF